MALHGFSRGKIDFISLSYVCQYGFVQDCLFKGNPETVRINELLNEFPVTSSDVEWPRNLIPIDEEE